MARYKKISVGDMPSAKFAGISADGLILFSGDDILTCMSLLRKHAKARLFRCVDGALLAFMSGAKPDEELEESSEGSA